jgi:hypothetical protein
MSQGILYKSVGVVGEAIMMFAEPLRTFGREYLALAKKLKRTRLPIALCTVYNGNLPGDEGRIAQIGVSLFNDIIQRTAISAGAHPIELRSICKDPEDFANPIEPSGMGGAKIAKAIGSWVAAAG